MCDVKDLGRAPLVIVPTPLNISKYNDKAFVNINTGDWIVVADKSLIKEADYLAGKARYLAGKAHYLAGKALYLAGKAHYLAGKAHYLVGKALYLAGKAHYLAAKVSRGGTPYIGMLRMIVIFGGG